MWISLSGPTNCYFYFLCTRSVIVSAHLCHVRFTLMLCLGWARAWCLHIWITSSILFWTIWTFSLVFFSRNPLPSSSAICMTLAPKNSMSFFICALCLLTLAFNSEDTMFLKNLLLFPCHERDWSWPERLRGVMSQMRLLPVTLSCSWWVSPSASVLKFALPPYCSHLLQVDTLVSFLSFPWICPVENLLFLAWLWLLSACGT